AEQSSLLPLFCFHARVKSSALIGVPSFHTASGLILYTIVCGLWLVSSADAIRSLLSWIVPSGKDLNTCGTSADITWASTNWEPSDVYVFQLVNACSSAKMYSPPCLGLPLLQVFGFLSQSA